MNHAKKLLVLRQQLIGLRYFNALRALTFAQSRHTGLRKDGVTPEFDHQLSIALFALTLPDVRYREEVIAAILLHDVSEDYYVSREEMRQIFFADPSTNFSPDRVSTAVWRVTKVFRGVKRNEIELFEEMALDEIASLVKGCDRMHNYQSMIGVFIPAKQRLYIDEGKTLIIPMLKKARRNFPEQTRAYENLKWMLNSQIQLIEASLNQLPHE